MGLMDKVKAQATQVAQKAQEGLATGQAKLEEVQGKRKGDLLLRDLGEAVYAQRNGAAGPDRQADIDRLIQEISAFEAEHGPISATAPSAGGPSSPAPSGPAAGGPAPNTAVPDGGFKLD